MGLGPYEIVNASGLWLDAQRVVDRAPQPPLAPEIPFRRLNRHVPEQELDLIQFAAGQVAEPRASPTQIVRRELLDAGTASRRSDHLPEDPRRHPVSPHDARLVNGPEDTALGNPSGIDPIVAMTLDVARTTAVMAAPGSANFTPSRD